MAKSIGIHFFGLNTFLDVKEIPKPKKSFDHRDTLTCRDLKEER